MKHFLFLYPIREYFDFEVQRSSRRFWAINTDVEVTRRLSEAEEEEKSKIVEESLSKAREKFRETYKTTLNACIDARYRQRDFTINYALFDGSPVSKIIDLQDSDRIIRVGMDFKTHTSKQKDGEYPYPDTDYILDQLEEATILRIGGFHMWDCVEKLARRSHERGIDTLVDEDLTEFFGWQMMRQSFKVDRYPNYNPKDDEHGMVELFMKAREGKPWLWQDY